MSDIPFVVVRFFIVQIFKLVAERSAMDAKSNYGKIAVAVALYWFVSISLVFINKYLLDSPSLHMNAPLFVTWTQCVITVLLCYFLSFFGRLFPNFVRFPKVEVQSSVAMQMLPLSCVFLAMVSTNNLCLRDVGVSFYQVARSLTSVFNIIFTYIVLRQSTSWRSIACCIIIIVGFSMGVDEEQDDEETSWSAIFFCVTSSCFVALYAIYMKKGLALVNDDVWSLTLYNNINASLLFIPCMLLNGELSELSNCSVLTEVTFWLLIFLGGVFGFAIGYVTGLQIKYTSPLTHNVSATAKACFQTLLAVLVFSERKSLMWWLSTAAVLVGTMLYTHVRRQEMEQAKARPAAPRDGQAAWPLLPVDAPARTGDATKDDDLPAKV